MKKLLLLLALLGLGGGATAQTFNGTVGAIFLVYVALNAFRIQIEGSLGVRRQLHPTIEISSLCPFSSHTGPTDSKPLGPGRLPVRLGIGYEVARFWEREVEFVKAGADPGCG